MEFKIAEISDAPLIHDLMIRAFMEYKDEVPPSSALEETVESISKALMDKEKGLIAYMDDKPVGMVRFQLKDDGLYFYRLSVIPEKQGQGVAKKLLNVLEAYALEREIPILYCKVRMSIPKNIHLYKSIGYKIYNEEVLHNRNGLKVVSMMKKL